jgi:thioredoxin reductase (NADPH)
MEVKMDKIYDIAVIGAGPAGIASSVESVVLGIENVVVFEKGDSHSMTIRQFYKDNKRVDKNWKGQEIELDGNVIFMDGTKESTIELFDKMIDTHNIDALFRTEISKISKDVGLFKIETNSNGIYHAKNIIIAIGKMGKPNKPDYKIPPSLKRVVNFNLEHAKPNEKTLVVGGGNSAVEYAYFLAGESTGVDVTLTYRRDKFARVNPENMVLIDKAVADNTLKLKIGVDIENIENVEGRIKVNYKDGTTDTYDRVIYALGGVMPIDFLKNCGVEINEDGKVVYDKNFETSIKGIYIAGDIAAHIGGSIAMSLNHAYAIINHIKENKLD